MKTILVGTDFSPGSDRALRVAGQLASDDTTIHLIHVLEPVDDPDSDDPETQSFYRKLEEKSTKSLADQLTRLDSGEAQTSVRIGPRHLTLLEVAEELNADLIVLGSKPMNPDSEVLSVSHRAALVSSRSILLVPG